MVFKGLASSDSQLFRIKKGTNYKLERTNFLPFVSFKYTLNSPCSICKVKNGITRTDTQLNRIFGQLWSFVKQRGGVM